MNTVIILILISYLGHLFSSVIIKDLKTLERLGISYILGMGTITQIIFYYSWVGIRITEKSIFLTVLLFIFLLQLVCVLINRDLRLRFFSTFRRVLFFRGYEKLIMFLISFTLIISFVLSVYNPITVWDALALYDFRAKIIANTGYFVQIAKNFDYFAHYPLMTSLMHTIVYLAGGENPQFTYSLIFISFVLFFYGNIRGKTSRIIALMSTLLLVTTPVYFQHSTISYTNLPYTIFYVIGTLCLYEAVVKNRLEYFVMSSLMIGFSTSVRATEPFWVIGILVVLVYSILKRNIRPLVSYLPCFLIIQQPWRIYQSYLFGYSSKAEISFVAGQVSGGISVTRLIEITRFIYENIVLTWGPISLLFLVTVFLGFKYITDKNNLLFLVLIFLNFSILFLGTYLFSFSFSGWEDIPDSARRLAMFFIPLMFYYSSLVISKVMNGRYI